jgi:TetR/AcrR family transcriptional repressor of nem operon
VKVSREQAARNRDRIIDVAARLFRENGFDGIGVADLMKSAGMTHGGFYGHFQSKDDLAAQACRRALMHSAESWAALAETSRGNRLGVLAKRYLSQSHRDSPGQGCVLAALGPDAARQGPAVREACTQGLQSLVDILEQTVPGQSRAARRKQALAIMAQMVGTIALARAVDDRELSTEILDATLADIDARHAVATRKHRRLRSRSKGAPS